MLPSPQGVSTLRASAATPSTNATVASLIKATTNLTKVLQRLIAGFASAA
jgi:hypothetical protein